MSLTSIPEHAVCALLFDYNVLIVDLKCLCATRALMAIIKNCIPWQKDSRWVIKMVGMKCKKGKYVNREE